MSSTPIHPKLANHEGRTRAVWWLEGRIKREASLERPDIYTARIYTRHCFQALLIPYSQRHIYIDSAIYDPCLARQLFWRGRFGEAASQCLELLGEAVACLYRKCQALSGRLGVGRDWLSMSPHHDMWSWQGIPRIVTMYSGQSDRHWLRYKFNEEDISSWPRIDFVMST